MPSQQAEVADAIAGIKRALKREREAPSDQPIVAASNRGNKLQQGARFVYEGSLTHVSGPGAYKRKIEHAGYTRYILDRNPRRYNEYGDELEDSETDAEADADAADQNAYSGIRLEELLCPLRYPSELSIHPTLSHAYLSNALPDMVSSTHEKLRQERANLWRAKYLNRQLTGDASWIPAGEVESPDDWDLFEPRYKGEQKQPSRKRKRQEIEHESHNGSLAQSSGLHSGCNGVNTEVAKPTQDTSYAQINGVAAWAEMEKNKNPNTKGQALNGVAVEGKEVANTTVGGATTSTDASYEDAAAEGPIDRQGKGKTELNGIGPPPTKQVNPDQDAQDQPRSPKQIDEPLVILEDKNETGEGGPGQVSHAASDADDGSPPPPPRRMTRALAANNNNSNSQSNAPTPPLSPASSSTTTSSSSQVQIDPLYLVPRAANPSNSALANHGLLPEEALETRRLLTMYIQKQEESVKGYEAILSKLLTAQRLRTAVLEMCKTEEHVGELSDGEDWINTERWGLQPGELRKGRDEDEDVMDENTIGGRKGKRRARN